jgi:hypothetical protein
MPTIMSYVTGFGLAGGSGAKAFIPVLALGAFHHTEYFELSERFQWVASPPVLMVLAVLVIVEIVVDSNPDLAAFGDTAAYLPKIVAGFIAFAAATGEVDSSLLELGGSGMLGGGTAAGVHWVRNRIRRPIRDSAEVLYGGVGKTASLLEAGASAGVATTAMVAPLISLLLLGGVGVAALFVVRFIENRRVSCVHCGEPIRPGALVCFHCKGEQSS